MRLTDALRISPGTTVAFVGAGGKTSAIRRLALEQPRLLIATTTRLGVGQSDLAVHHLVHPTDQELHRIPELLEQHGTVLVTGPEQAGKWTAASPQIIQALAEVGRAAQVPLAVEADGARGRSLKAPAEHEPAIPSLVDLVVPIAGLDVLGRAIDSGAVHRPERVAALLGLDGADTLDTRAMATVLSTPQGGLKGVPEAAAVRVLLTHATEARLSDGQSVAEYLLASPRIQAVALADFEAQAGVREVRGRVAGVLLAAGGSSRLGEAKQLIEFRGHPLLWHAAQAARALDPLVVVVGDSASAVRAALTDAPLEFVENPDWESGQSSSVRLGLQAVEHSAEAVVFLLADMPFVGAELVEALIDRHRQTLAPLVAPWAGGRRANPVLFDRSTFADLKELEGDRGGRALFKRYRREFVEWDESILLDVDRPEDLRRLRELE